jgi:hypothetical protein
MRISQEYSDESWGSGPVFSSELKRDAVNEDVATRVRQCRGSRLDGVMKIGGAKVVLKSLKRGTLGFEGEYE